MHVTMILHGVYLIILLDSSLSYVHLILCALLSMSLVPLCAVCVPCVSCVSCVSCVPCIFNVFTFAGSRYGCHAVVPSGMFVSYVFECVYLPHIIKFS